MKSRKSILVRLQQFFYTILVIVILQSCVTENTQNTETVMNSTSKYHSVSAIDYYSNGMHYKVFNSTSGSLFVINITNDSIQH